MRFSLHGAQRCRERLEPFFPYLGWNPTPSPDFNINGKDEKNTYGYVTLGIRELDVYFICGRDMIDGIRG